MRIGFSCYMLNPFDIGAGLSPAVNALELLIPAGRLKAAEQIRRELLLPGKIEPILTVLCFSDRIGFDAEGPPLSWSEGLPYVELFAVRRLRVVGVQNKRIESDEAFIHRLAEQIKMILPWIESRNITMAYENHGEKSDVVLALVRMVKHPNFRILLDPANGYISEEMPEHIMEVLLPYTEYFHIKDIIRPPVAGVGRPPPWCPVGEGITPWRELFANRMVPSDRLFVFELPGYQGNVMEGYRAGLRAFRRIAERQ